MNNIEIGAGFAVNNNLSTYTTSKGENQKSFELNDEKVTNNKFLGIGF